MAAEQHGTGLTGSNLLFPKLSIVSSTNCLVQLCVLTRETSKRKHGMAVRGTPLISSFGACPLTLLKCSSPNLSHCHSHARCQAQRVLIRNKFQNCFKLAAVKQYRVGLQKGVSKKQVRGRKKILGKVCAH